MLYADDIVLCGTKSEVVEKKLEERRRAMEDRGLKINLPSSIIELAMWLARMYVSHVLDRKLLERLMSPSPKSQVMFAPAVHVLILYFDVKGR